MNRGLAVKLQDLSFQIGGRVVLDALTLELDCGVSWIRGPNGTGKTTLLKLLGGALQPSRGSLLIGDQTLAQMTSVERQCVFFCGDDLADLPWLTAGELMAVYGCVYQNLDHALLGMHLEKFKLPPVLGTAITALSLGERRKLQLSVALSVNARVLLLDEPFNALDASAMALVKDELKRRHASSIQVIVLTSHTDPCIGSKVFGLCGGANSCLRAVGA